MELKKGLVSVIMCNYNTPEEYLRTAIESILNQTYSNLEFIIVDDCSTDGSTEIIKSYTDSRIVLLENKDNLGLTKSLNIALNQSNGEYIARMDSDDYSFPHRIEKQVAYLSNHPRCILCGTGIELFGSGANNHRQKIVIKKLPEREEWKIWQLFGNHRNIIHPTAMFNNILLRKFGIQYNENFIYAQDYRIWIDCNKAAECFSMNEVLFKYRIHDGAISSFKKDIQDDCAKRIMQEQLSWLGLKLPHNWDIIHEGFFDGRKEYSLSQKKWIRSIIAANKKYNIYNQKMLEKMVWSKWAETTYFKLFQSSSKEKIKALFNLPVKYWKELYNIKRMRTKKEKENG